MKAYGANCCNEIIKKSSACVLGDTRDTEIKQYLKGPLIPFYHAYSYVCWRKQASFYTSSKTG